MKGIEIERKYLIAYPDAAVLEGAARSDIVQTYLLSESDVTHRVRSRTYGDQTRYFETVKRRINAVSCHEDEREIDRREYEALLAARDPARRDVIKTRYCLPFGGHVIEIDVYPFWQDRAILEVELADEGEQAALPDSIRVIREVTEDKRYKNAALAAVIPYDAI